MVKQPIYSRLKVKNCWHHVLYTDIISFFVTQNPNNLGKKNLAKIE